VTRRHRLLAALIAGLVAAAAFTVVRSSNRDGRGSDRPALRVGFAPPPFTLPDLRDPSATISSTRLIGAPTVVAFLSSTCVPCRTELPILQSFADEHPGLRVIGIDHLEFREQGLRFVEDLGVGFPVAHDEAGETAVAWLVPGLPATFFVDAQGRLSRSLIGPATRSDLESGLRAILR
jgi:cytochrome c biogenesis protein CcmG, thiol:disulfide interchange protein DsbE